MDNKRAIGYVPGQPSVLDVKVPKNSQYDKIEKVVDSNNLFKDVPQLSSNLIAKLRQELFKRITCSTLAAAIKRESHSECIYNIGREEDMKQSAVILPPD